LRASANLGGMPGSFDQPARPVLEPSPWVRRFGHLIAPGSTVLDVACGHGRHARWARAAGHPVVAVDIDVTGVADLAAQPGVEVLRHDLESGDWPFACRAFGAIIVANYLDRGQFDAWAAALAPGGVLLVDTFGSGNEAFGRPRSPAFLLAPGELLAAFGHRLQVVAYEAGIEALPRLAVRQRLCAVNSPVPLPLIASAQYLLAGSDATLAIPPQGN
jgi:SAM-dependent methyltransferase